MSTSTPSARFVISFGADTSGVSQATSAIDTLRGSIEKDTKALGEMQAAMQRLKGTAEVTRWEGLPKDIAKSQSEISKLQKQLAPLKENLDIAKQARVSPGDMKTLTDQISPLEKALESAQKRLHALTAEQKHLGGSHAVKTFEDMKASSDKLKSSIGNSQVSLSRLGGSMGETKGAASSMQALAEASQQVPGPLGSMAGQFKQLAALGPVGLVAAIAVAVVMLGVAIAKTAWEFGKLIVQSADAARSALLLDQGAATAKASAGQLHDAMLRVEGRTSATREAVTELIHEYARLGLTIRGIEGAANAVTIATQAAGAQAGSVIKGLIDRGVNTKRFWVGAFDLKGTGLTTKDVATQVAKQMKVSIGVATAALRDGRIKLEDGIKALEGAVETRFGDIARKQMLALPVQIDRLKQNLASIFKDVDIEPVLSKLRDLLSIFEETHEIGKSLRSDAKTLFQPLIAGASAALPLMEGMIYGAILAVQTLTIWGLKAAVAIKKLFGDSKVFKDLDMVKTGAYIGAAAIMAMVVAFVLLGVALAAVMAPLAIVGGTVGAIGYGIVKAVMDIVGSISALVDYMRGVDVGAAASGIVDAIAEAVRDGVGKVAKAFSELAEAGLKAFNKTLGIASPAKVVKKAAKWIAPGVVEAVDEGRPAVARSLQRLVDPSDVGQSSSTGAPGAGAVGGNSTTNHFHYHGSGSRSDAQKFGQWVFESLETLALARGHNT